MNEEARETVRGEGLKTPSALTLKRLYALSGNACAYPDCKVAIVDGAAHVGDVCHIRAASAGGPRFDPNQTANERHGEANLILLCANHHRVIDSDVARFTVSALEKMKAEHEASAGRLSERDIESGAKLLLSLNQSGGVTAHHIETLNVTMHTPAEQPRALPVSAGMTFVGMDDVLAHMGPNGNARYAFDTEHFIYLRLIPLSGPQVGLPDLLKSFKQARILPMHHNWSGTAERNRCGAMYYTQGKPGQIIGFTQGFPSGELWGMNSEVFQSQSMPAEAGEPHGLIPIVPSVAMEKLYVETLNNYVQVAQKVFNALLPYRIELGVKGIEHAYVSFPRPPAGFLHGPIYERAFRRTYSLVDATPGAINALLAEYFDAFYSELVGYKRKDVMAANFIAAHNLPISL